MIRFIQIFRTEKNKAGLLVSSFTSTELSSPHFILIRSKNLNRIKSKQLSLDP